jgi:hypothetical protein
MSQNEVPQRGRGRGYGRGLAGGRNASYHYGRGGNGLRAYGGSAVSSEDPQAT